jgi:hypothetical protein
MVMARLEYHFSSGKLNIMEDFTHAYCEMCDAIQPVTQESLTDPDTSGKLLGGDLLCTECRFVIATLYKRLDGDDTKIIPPPGSI